MKIFHVSQIQNNNYDTFSDFVVVAKDADTAKNTHPNGYRINWARMKRCKSKYQKYLDDIEGKVDFCDDCQYYSDRCDSWAVDPEYVTVHHIGDANKGYKKTTIICTSFNAG